MYKKLRVPVKQNKRVNLESLMVQETSETKNWHSFIHDILNLVFLTNFNLIQLIISKLFHKGVLIKLLKTKRLWLKNLFSEICCLCAYFLKVKGIFYKMLNTKLIFTNKCTIFFAALNWAPKYSTVTLLKSFIIKFLVYT